MSCPQFSDWSVVLIGILIGGKILGRHASPSKEMSLFGAGVLDKLAADDDVGHSFFTFFKRILAGLFCVE